MQQLTTLEDNFEKEYIPKNEENLKATLNIFFTTGDDRKEKDDFKNEALPKLRMFSKNTAKRNMASAMCGSSMYSRLCMKMSSFLFLHTRALPRMLYLSCGIPFPV